VPDVERYASKNFLSDLKREITDSPRDLGRRVIASSILSELRRQKNGPENEVPAQSGLTNSGSF
jgi:hypothetical protein